MASSATSENSVSSTSFEEIEKGLRDNIPEWEQGQHDYMTLLNFWRNSIGLGRPEVTSYLDLRLRLLVNSIPEDEFKAMWLDEWDEMKDNIAELKSMCALFSKASFAPQAADRIVAICVARLRELFDGST